MIAGDEAGGAGAEPVALDRRDGGGFDLGSLCEIEIVVAREREQLLAVALDEDLAARGLGEHAPQPLAVERRELLGGEFVERGHSLILPLSPQGRGWRAQRAG